jgi:hypothetical protein
LLLAAAVLADQQEVDMVAVVVLAVFCKDMLVLPRVPLIR